MEEIEFIIKIQRDTLMVLFGIFENPVTVHEDNQEVIALAIALQMRPCMKHIMIKYHHFHSFVANGDVCIQHIDTKEQITDILQIH